MTDILARQRQIVGTSDDWDSHNITLGDGELALERFPDGSVRAKVGNGTLPFSDSPYLGGFGGGGGGPAFEFTATDGQTDFPLDYTPGGMVVFVNGVRLANAEFIATDGETVVLGAPAAAGDIVVLQPGGEGGEGGGGDASAITYTAPLPGAVRRTVAAELSETIKAPQFGTVGDGVANDRPAIQAALDAAGAAGGSRAVFLPAAPVGYRINAGLKLPGNVELYGETPVRYPFNASNPNTSRLIADFADPNQWMIEPKTTIGGAPIGYNTMVEGDLPDGATYNCRVRDLVLTSTGALPFGGIRMHGCPGSMIENVGVHRVGCGVLVNYCFGGRYIVHTLAQYYGFMGWNDVNANTIEAYNAQLQPYVAEIPAAYRLGFMAALDGQLVPTFGFGSNDHHKRPIGFGLGSVASLCVNNSLEVVAERFADGLFMLGARANNFVRLYLEGAAGEMLTALALGVVSGRIGAVHVNGSGTGNLFDLAANMDHFIDLNSLVSVAAWGPGPPPASDLRVGTVPPGFLGRTNAPNVKFVDKDGPWTVPTLNAPATNLGGSSTDFGYRITRGGMVEIKGYLNNLPAKPFVAFTLPAGFRPDRTWYLPGADGVWGIESNGNVSVTEGGGAVSASGISFHQVN